MKLEHAGIAVHLKDVYQLKFSWLCEIPLGYGDTCTCEGRSEARKLSAVK